jgi:cation diffusion facilitator family transporter
MAKRRQQQAANRPLWHSLPAEQALDVLHSDRQQGLSSDEAASRLARYGRNRLPQAKRRGPLLRFLSQFHNVLIYVLLASALGALATGDRLDAIVIFGVVFINAIIGFVQEGKAESALQAIANMLSLSASVLRDGQRGAVAAEELVPGDIVFLQSGDKVPADVRLLDVKNLRIDESALTGESQAVEKSTDPAAADAVPGDRCGMAFSGTLVVYGQAEGVVAETGAHTELGRISALLNQVNALETPLQKQLTQFANWLTLCILLLAAATFSFGVTVRGYPLDEMFMAVVGIAVAAIPEGLPAVVTITLAVGVQRMARRNAIVRHLPAVETLGSVTVICSDKTGTLTRNEMTVRSVATRAAEFAVEGASYEARGRFLLDGWPVQAEDYPLLLELARAGLLCNDASLVRENGGVHLLGDPTEGALLGLGVRAGWDLAKIRQDYPRLDSIPFESEHRFMATLNRDTQGETWIYLKGAPEAVLGLCSRQRIGEDESTLDVAHWQTRIHAMAEQGQRVLALAVKPAPDGMDTLSHADLGEGFSLLGLCGLIDPPREEAIESVAQCHAAGIRVKMITGDHGATASAIGRQLAIGEGQTAMLGSEVEALSDRGLAGAARKVDVFARTSPEHKLRLVEALQAKGEIVAMTGDGVNDAPALKRADVGVAMGKKGTEAAKEAAVMVLADDNFATIVHAVEEGRTIHDNLKKAIMYILPTSLGQAGAIIVGILLGLTLPITPLQILWVNMVTAISLSLSLSFEPPEADVMRRPPRNPQDALIGGFFIWRIIFVSLLLVGGLLGLFLYELQLGSSIETARTAAVNALVIGEITYLFNSRYIHASSLSPRGVFGNPYAWLAIGVLLLLQAAFTYAPAMQALFETTAIDAEAWRRILAFGLLLFLVVELEKGVVRVWLAWRRKSPAHEHVETAPSKVDRSKLARYAWLSIAAAITTIGLKAWAWRLTGSVGLLSDAMESLVNLVAAVVALGMLTLAAKPPDDEHHYGHGKAEYFSSGLEGALILVAAFGIAMAAYDRFLHPQPLEAVGLGLGISVFASLLNLAVALVLLRVGRRHGSITLEADAKHLLTDVWTSVGVVLAIGAVALTGWQRLDPIIAFAVAVNIVWSGVTLMRRSASGLLDATLPQEENQRIDDILDRYRQERRIEFHDLRTRQAGVDRFMTVHVLVPGAMTVKAGHDLLEQIEADIRQAVGEITVVTHLEPLDDPASFSHGDSEQHPHPGRESLSPIPPRSHKH